MSGFEPYSASETVSISVEEYMALKDVAHQASRYLEAYFTSTAYDRAVTLRGLNVAAGQLQRVTR